MSYNITWRIYCLTEQDWSQGTLLDTDGDPTECFNDSGHSINVNSIQIISQENLSESNDPTSGAMTTIGGLGVVKSVCIGKNLCVDKYVKIIGADSGDPTTISQIHVDSISITDTTTSTSANVSQVVFNKFGASTINASNTSVTVTDAATVFIEGSPIAGINQTITNSYGLLVDGNSRINGTLNVDTLNVNSLEAYVRDEKVVGSNGGTFYDDSWRTRDLNTITTDTGSGISLASNQITLQPGTYTVWAKAPAYKVDEHQIRFYNITDSTTDILGTIEYSKNTTSSFLYSKLTIASTKVYELQHICDKDRRADGFGKAGGFTTEIFSIVIIKRLC